MCVMWIVVDMHGVSDYTYSLSLDIYICYVEVFGQTYTTVHIVLLSGFVAVFRAYMANPCC